VNVEVTPCSVRWKRRNGFDRIITYGALRFTSRDQKVTRWPALSVAAELAARSGKLLIHVSAATSS
jgi:hypothetical protein